MRGPRRLRQGAVVIVQETGILHGAQHDLGPGQRSVGVAQGIVARRGLDAARQHGGFRDVQLIGMLAKNFSAAASMPNTPAPK